MKTIIGYCGVANRIFEVLEIDLTDFLFVSDSEYKLYVYLQYTQNDDGTYDTHTTSTFEPISQHKDSVVILEEFDGQFLPEKTNSIE